jgi:DNA-binding NtrC family response regulator
MVFALGGEREVQEIRRRRFVVVVSDFRMPVVDGMTLLSTAATVCPDSARIMLSGDAEGRLKVQAVRALHDCSSNPAIQRHCAAPSNAESSQGRAHAFL